MVMVTMIRNDDGDYTVYKVLSMRKDHVNMLIDMIGMVIDGQYDTVRLVDKITPRFVFVFVIVFESTICICICIHDLYLCLI